MSVGSLAKTIVIPLAVFAAAFAAGMLLKNESTEGDTKWLSPVEQRLEEQRKYAERVVDRKVPRFLREILAAGDAEFTEESIPVIMQSHREEFVVAYLAEYKKFKENVEILKSILNEDIRDWSMEEFVEWRASELAKQDRNTDRWPVMLGIDGKRAPTSVSLADWEGVFRKHRFGFGPVKYLKGYVCEKFSVTGQLLYGFPENER